MVLFLGVENGRAQSMTYVAQVCKKMVRRQVPGGSEIAVSQCGNRFTPQDPYAVLVVTLYDVHDAQTISADLDDPTGNQVWTYTWTLASPGAGSDRYWASASFYALLPIGGLSPADAALVGGGVIRLEGKPAAERPGEWTFRARVGNGRLQRKFTIGAQ
jgi:hypothetical protein